ncbi:hydrolase, alpha/beta fold family protein [Marinomonas sp. MED121]|uniref:COG3904 family protein n=1 Tax=Marinomonas sp. MED121 TaxID=314277 RepID=UPI00006900A2|nr:alpha/beta hydrolase [Marinomonas sp. MED121]EAQ65642.1 hydrolase, alpha/beta fold family protein [Marinomonas sp. MED121]
MNHLRFTAIKCISLCVLFLSLVGCSNLNTQASKPNLANLDNPQLEIYIEKDVAFISGVLGPDLPEQLTNMVRQSPNIQTLVLVDIPGSIDQEATMQAARLIRRLGLNTMIARTGYVLSGGVDLFLGGVKRNIGAGAGVGVHSWYDQLGIEPEELNLADPIHGTYVNFYLEMGVPERFYWFSLDAAPAERVYFMSPEEIYDFQIATD